MPGFLKRLLIVGPLFVVAYLVYRVLHPVFAAPEGFIQSTFCTFDADALVTRRRGFMCSDFASLATSAGLGVLVAVAVLILGLMVYSRTRNHQPK